jgi:hypothetical protein
MISLLSRSFSTYPIVTWGLVGVSAYLFKAGAVATYQRRHFAKDNALRTQELSRV